MTKGLAQIHANEMIARRTTKYRSIEDLWRRADIPVAALERLAEADAFQTLGLDRRQALWAIRGLSDTRLPLFDTVPAEPDAEPAVALAAMTAGRQVVEDYRSHRPEPAPPSGQFPAPGPRRAPHRPLRRPDDDP